MKERRQLWCANVPASEVKAEHVSHTCAADLPQSPATPNKRLTAKILTKSFHVSVNASTRGQKQDSIEAFIVHSP